MFIYKNTLSGFIIYSFIAMALILFHEDFYRYIYKTQSPKIKQDLYFLSSAFK